METSTCELPSCASRHRSSSCAGASARQKGQPPLSVIGLIFEASQTPWHSGEACTPSGVIAPDHPMIRTRFGDPGPTPPRSDRRENPRPPRAGREDDRWVRWRSRPSCPRSSAFLLRRRDDRQRQHTRIRRRDRDRQHIRHAGAHVRLIRGGDHELDPIAGGVTTPGKVSVTQPDLAIRAGETIRFTSVAVPLGATS